MRVREFYELLNKTGYHWYIDGFGELRADTRNGDVICPITGVCRKLKRKKYSVVGYQKAARKLGLRKRDFEGIVDAADNEYPVRGQKRVRNKLLKACRVK